MPRLRQLESMGGHLATLASEEEWNDMVAEVGITTYP